jgi:hypothetical protein
MQVTSTFGGAVFGSSRGVLVSRTCSHMAGRRRGTARVKVADRFAYDQIEFKGL